MYVDSGNNALGIFSNCPVDRILDVRLFAFFNSSTVVLLAAAIEYKVSPFGLCRHFLLLHIFLWLEYEEPDLFVMYLLLSYSLF